MKAEHKEIVISTPVRTPIGAFGGVFKNVPAVELGAAAIRDVLFRSKLSPDKVDAVLMGNVIQAGNKMNPARQAAIHGGLSISTPAMTLNRVCGSGLQAVINATQEILSGTAEALIAGGMENMDMAPYLDLHGRYGSRLGDRQIYDAVMRDGLSDAFSDKPSGWVTEDLATKYDISRQSQDEWAAQSQQKFAIHQEAGMFDEEIVPVEVPDKKGPQIINRDSSNRPDTTIETLAKLKPAFRPDGTITAGNSPGINSGASAMLVTSREFADKNSLKPIARIIAYSVVAVDPAYFGIAPAPAIKLVIKRAGWTLAEVDRFEINEAFAAVPLAVAKEIGIDLQDVNVDGGAVAHGHPIGATGAILLTRLAYSLRRDGLSKGIVSLCIGGGQGVALAIESIN